MISAQAIDVCFLWHMHQPEYTSPLTGRPVLPWVRIHAVRAYLDMAAALARFPLVKATVNFVPSLVSQLEAYLAGVRDELELMCEKPASTWSEAERVSALKRLYSVHRMRGIETRPRFRELLNKRGELPSEQALTEAARSFSPNELTDLVVLFHLAHFGFVARNEEPLVKRLEEKGRDFSHEDVLAMLSLMRTLSARVLPSWRALAERGQVELSASPYHHPIVPLLCDSDSARRAMPKVTLPPRFSWPEDGQAQIARGKAAHERVFGKPPNGMWPPEGSVSPEALRRYALEHIAWLVTDEGVLWNSLGHPPRTPDSLLRSYKNGSIQLLFRDRELSDRIGFAYSNMPANVAARDLLGRVRELGRAFHQTTPNERPLVTLALDGENAWEAYEGVGEPFLTALYRQLSEAQDLHTLTVSEAISKRTPRNLEHVHSGSWIDSDFHIWIGDTEKNRAWEALGTARRRIAEAARSTDPMVRKGAALALERIYPAEGSDWFWWFGEPFHSQEDDLFASIFAAHLKGVYEALDEPLDVAFVQGQSTAGKSTTQPTSFIAPKLSGRTDSFFAWRGAGRYEVSRGQTMGLGTVVIERVFWGFDAEKLYFRVDPAEREIAALRGGKLQITFSWRHVGRKIDVVVGPIGPRGAASFAAVPDGAGSATPIPHTVFAYEEVLELALPYSALTVKAHEEVGVKIVATLADGTIVDVVPEGALTIHIPDEQFESDHWSA